MNASLDVNDIWFPDLPIIDTHHHLFERLPTKTAAFMRRKRFVVDDYASTIRSEHRVVASVAIQIGANYREDGPEELRPVGETEFLNAQANSAATEFHGPCRVAAGIVSYADLRRGDKVRALLEAHLDAAPDRFKGIRQEAIWDADPSILGGYFDVSEHLYDQHEFRSGYKHLSSMGLSFDAFVLAPQLPDVVALARSFPDTSIILNHLGNPVGIGAYKDRLQAEFSRWRTDMAALAACHNVTVKLGGFGDYLIGLKFDPATTFDTLVAVWRPYIETALDLFGAGRCMFESNIPVDDAGSFHLVCNTFKEITSGCSHAERTAVFSGTAARVYRIRM